MSSEWQVFTLGEVTDWASGGTPKKDVLDYWNGDIPWISASSMHGTRFSDSDLKITQSGLKNGSRLAAKDSILLLVRGSALHNKIPVGIVTRDVAFNQDVKAILPKKQVSPWYLLFWLMGNEQFLLNSVVEFTGIGAGKLDTKRMQALEIVLPSRKEQDSIVEIIKALDDRITLLRETNATLEAIAQALFKSWFVDFDPVHAKQQGRLPEGMDEQTAALFPDSFEESELGLVPAGWEVGTLGDMSKNNSAPFDFSKVEKVVFVNTGDVLNGEFLHQNYSSKEGLPGQAKKAIYEDDILFSEIRPKNGRFAYVNFDAKDYVVSTKFMVLRAINNIPPRYLYQVLRQTETIEYFNVIAESRSGTFPQITFDSVKNYKLIKPSSVCLEKYIECVNPIFHKVDLLNKQVQTLADLRDTLLPRLISGQLRVGDVEIAA